MSRRGVDLVVDLGVDLVVGLGSRDRGDDAVGPVTAARVAVVAATRVRVLEQEDPTDLVLAWEGHDDVVVVDAVVSGELPGTVRVVEAGAEAESAVSPRTWSGTGAGGTHAFGLAEAVELARVLGRLPARVHLVLVEAADVTPGAPLSPPVAAAVPRAVETVLSLLPAETPRVPGRDAPRAGSTRPACRVETPLVPATASPGGARHVPG